jgi:cysteinyl-tRNA synthetase
MNGDDKMVKASIEQKMSPEELAKKYTKYFLEDIKLLNIEDPEYIVKVTDNIKEMEQYVIDILNNGYAYETSKGVYFDTSKLETYGELSKLDLDNLKSGARIEIDEEKKNPLDFALWIKAPSNHIMKWDSKFGLCYPGWHIECSAICKKYLGEVIDIHTGGVDHIPVHHENEIAQSRGATGKNPAKYWMHSEFLLIDNGKMSKSLGNVYKLSDIEEKGYDILSFRYLSFTSHYRNKLNFTWEGLKNANISLLKMRQLYKEHKEGNYLPTDIKEYENKFLEAINDDLNMPQALAVVWDILKNNKSKEYAKLLLKFDTVLSLDFEKEENIEISDEVKEILNLRKQARENKDFKTSDDLRDKLNELGYNVKDTKDEQILERR